MKADRTIEKFRLRDSCVVGGALGQKMDEECIQAFIKGDPSGTAKYLEWMLYQAGGGKVKLDRSIRQWEEGEYGEPSIRETLRKEWINDLVQGYTDDDGQKVPAISREAAEKQWAAQDEKMLRNLHIYGDEDYVQHGSFGFVRHWPGPNGLYDVILRLVIRFHRYAAGLKAKGKSTDLCLANYPNVADLAIALKDVMAAELINDLDYDTVFADEWVVVVCPFNIGASLKFGIQKWCTSNESNFTASLTGESRSRWKEYAEHNALYYCRLRKVSTTGAFPVNAVAIQVSMNPATNPAFAAQPPSMPDWESFIAGSNYWDAEDKNSNLEDWLTKMGRNSCVTLDHLNSFRLAMRSIIRHAMRFPRHRVVVNYGI